MALLFTHVTGGNIFMMISCS